MDRNNNNNNTHNHDDDGNKRQDLVVIVANDNEFPLPQLQDVLRDNDDDDEEEAEAEQAEEDNDNDLSLQELQDIIRNGHDEDEEEEEEEDEADDADDDSSHAESIDLGPVPSPEDVDLEYTYPNDFIGRSWEDVLGDELQFFRLLIDPSCTEIELDKFMHCIFLIELIFLEGCTILRIGEFAFCGCSNLQRMNPLPEGLTSIDEYAFDECVSLQDEIIIPSTVILLGRSCFGGCKSIRSVVFTEPSTTTASTTAAATVFVEIRDFAFKFCDELQSVRLPRNVLYIPAGCFVGCSRLVKVPIPLSVREIRYKSFFACFSLPSIDLSENINGIENEAYSGCFALKNVTIRSSNSAITMGNNIFRDCPAISSLTVFPSVWPKLFQSMNNHAIEIDTTQRRENHYNNTGDRTDNHLPDFIYKFLKEYHYQMDRIIEWKKSEDHGERMITLNLCGDTNCEIDEEVDDGKRRRLR